MTKNSIIYPCPQCQKEVTWDNNNPSKPFCSERCRLVDLGSWASEEYQVPASDSGLEDSMDPEKDDWNQSPLH